MKYSILIFTIILTQFYAVETIAQECIGGQILTNEAFLYGRFEVSMRSAEGGGIVSSFFLYNLDLGCNWPEENNEIDIEMTGNSENILFTTHYPGPWHHTDTYFSPFNPHESLHDYAIEWEPGVVRWFVDGELAGIQDQLFVDGLIYPLRLMMNFWSADNVDWVGEWDPSVMPVFAEYDYVRCYEYTPGAGDSGTNNDFSLLWEDDFNELNEDLWTVEEHGGFGGNFCTFKPEGVEFLDGHLLLKMIEDIPTGETIPVTFSVDVSQQSFDPSDLIYLNGEFNDWCGTCELMTENDGVWSKTINLPPGEYEYLYTLNFWEENGGAPEGSECDHYPCDEWTNYGFVINEGSEPIVLDTYCWGECGTCIETAVESGHSMQPGKLIKICDMLGREVEFTSGQPLLYYYDDGTVERKVVLER